MTRKRQCVLLRLGIVLTTITMPSASSRAADVTLDLGSAKGVTMVGAVRRWDEDGNPRRQVDPNAKMDAPYVDATARAHGGKWVLKDLPAGKYDLIVMADGRLRIEGFTFPPVLEMDPFFPGSATTEEETHDFIVDDIKKSKHYENRVVPLYVGGNKEAVRVLVMLIRDQATSYTPGAGTMRHEVWQYTWNYGTWQKEKRTRVLDRLILPVSELRRWTWLWDPKLGGIEVKDEPVTVKYEMPKAGEKRLKGLYPY